MEGPLTWTSPHGILTVLVQLIRFIHKEGCYGTSGLPGCPAYLYPDCRRFPFPDHRGRAPSGGKTPQRPGIGGGTFHQPQYHPAGLPPVGGGRVDRHSAGQGLLRLRTAVLLRRGETGTAGSIGDVL